MRKPVSDFNHNNIQGSSLGRESKVSSSNLQYDMWRIRNVAKPKKKSYTEEKNIANHA